MKKLFFSVMICLCAWGVAAGSVLAAGLEVTPPRLDITVYKTSVTARLEVKNPTADVELFEVNLDGNEQGISFRPKSFTLEAGQSQTVLVEARPTSAKSVADVISIVATPLKGGGASLGGGVKVPLRVEFAHGVEWYRGSANWLKIAGVLIFTFGALWVSRRRRL